MCSKTTQRWRGFKYVVVCVNKLKGANGREEGLRKRQEVDDREDGRKGEGEEDRQMKSVMERRIERECL